MTTNLPAATKAAYSALLVQEPVAATEAIRQWLRSSLTISATILTEGRYPEGRASYTVAVGCDLDGLTSRKRAEAVEHVAAACLTPTEKDAATWVAALHSATAHAKGDEAGLRAVLALYTAALRRWPADVAKHACLNLALAQRDGPTWFPTLGELDGECERLGASRRMLLKALEAWTPETTQDAAKADLERRATASRVRSQELQKQIPMGYRMETPRSQWSGDYAAAADEADALDREAYRLETEARTGAAA